MTAAGQFRLLALSASVGAAVVCVGSHAEARPHHSHTESLSHALHGGSAVTLGVGRHGHNRVADTGFGRFSFNAFHGRHHSRSAAYGHSGGGIQCVTFARADSGIELSGNASSWWYNAAGIYQRGNRPEPGSVLNFRANGAMRMGHVAVVNHVIDSRTIDIDHANWGGPGAVRGGISRDISVVDVSPNNDWSAVRVALGHSGEYGSIYPTYGFIYNRPDSGRLEEASNSSPVPALNPAPRDLRPRYSLDEVAEAPDSAEPVGGFRRVSYRHHHLGHHGYATTVSHHHAEGHHRSRHRA